MKIVKTPVLIRYLFNGLVWKVAGNEKTIYLTFDDGPTPEATPYVLDMLDRYRARATFFCVGDNIRKHDEIFKAVISGGHMIGNHTFNHLNGWKTPDEEYFQNIGDCHAIIHQTGYLRNQKLFRPPYGRIKWSQLNFLKQKYKIVMWDILTRDYNPGHNPDALLKKILKSTVSGSIVVFHDSKKALPGLRLFLEKFLKHFTLSGYTFSTLENIS